MSRSIDFISRSIPGYGTPDGKRLPHPGVSKRAMLISPNSSHGDYTLISNVKFSSLRCHSGHSSVRNAGPSYYRRNNPDFPKQNKNGFSRNKNRPSEEINGYDDLDESEGFLTSKNGPLLGNRKFQTTASPGAREKEIVEIFRKVQAQLRQRSALKEEKKKVESSQGKNKESETVDSLLKLLRKHSVQQGNKNISSVSDRDFILDRPEQVDSSTEESVMVKDEIQESPRSIPSRLKSNFSRRSPVPEVKFQPLYSEDSVSPVEHDNLDPSGEGPETNDTGEPVFSEGNVFDEMSDIEISEDDESEHESGEDEDDVVEVSDVSGMKMVELRALAKSRGLKGFSKLKKNELIDLLNDSSI